MPVSIKDIAKLAGVSHSTVSRALRNSPLIPEATAERIREIARESGYTASAIGRGLVTNKTEAIGVVVTSIADPFNGEVVAGIEEVANRHGYSVILANSLAEPEREIAAVRGFQARRVDGIVVASSRLGALHSRLLAELRIPMVLLNNQHPSGFTNTVSVDNVHGAYRATLHLVKLGHKKIGYLGDKFGLHSEVERYAGYRKMMAEAGLQVRKEFVLQGDGKPEAALGAAAELLARPDRPTALFCYNDMTALGALHAAARQRISVPKELSVVGFDDIFFSRYLSAPLTTVAQPKRQLGSRATRLLLSVLAGKTTDTKVILRGQLVVRDSTAAVEENAPTSRFSPGKTRRPVLRNKV